MPFCLTAPTLAAIARQVRLAILSHLRHPAVQGLEDERVDRSPSGMHSNTLYTALVLWE